MPFPKHNHSIIPASKAWYRSHGANTHGWEYEWTQRTTQRELVYRHLRDHGTTINRKGVNSEPTK